MWTARMTTLGAAMLLLAGCASVTRGTEEAVVFDSEPPGAEMRSLVLNICHEEGSCRAEGDERSAPINREHRPGPVCVTPCTLQVKRKDELLATFSKPGYQAQTVMVKNSMSAGGGAGVAGNLLFGGVGGLVVDSATGAGLDHSPNPVKVVLVPIGGGRP